MSWRALLPSSLRSIAADANPAGGGKEQAAHELDGGRLAGAVGPEEGEHLAAHDLQTQVVDGDLVAVMLGDVFQLNHGVPIC